MTLSQTATALAALDAIATPSAESAIWRLRIEVVSDDLISQLQQTPCNLPPQQPKANHPNRIAV